MVVIEKFDTIHLNADMFIIPNSVCTIDEYFISSFQKKMLDNCKINGLVESPKEKMVQIWLTNELSDNIGCHGIKVNGKRYSVNCDCIPYSLIKNAKEGDVITVNFLGYEKDEELNNVKTVVFEMNLKCNQKEYRYRSFGSFDEILNRLVA